jgi:hypothetical protein
MDGKEERNGKEAAVTFTLLFWHSGGGPKENLKK